MGIGFSIIQKYWTKTAKEFFMALLFHRDILDTLSPKTVWECWKRRKLDAGEYLSMLHLTVELLKGFFHNVEAFSFSFFPFLSVTTASELYTGECPCVAISLTFCHWSTDQCFWASLQKGKKENENWKVFHKAQFNLLFWISIEIFR